MMLSQLHVWILFIVLVVIDKVYGQCGGVPAEVTAWVGQVKSESYGGYPSGLSCYWKVVVSIGSIVEISLTDFGMSSAENQNAFKEDCSDAPDYMEIYDGNATASLIKRFCGWVESSTTTYRSTKNSLLIFMKTTESGHRGFILDHKGICHLSLTALNGLIDSPQYPNKYPQLTDCLWLLDFGYGMNVSFRFNFFEFEDQPKCNYDFVAFYAGYNKSGTLLGQYCSFTVPSPLRVNGPLALYFESDTDTEFRGFSGEYHTTDINECETGNDCHYYAFCNNTIGSYQCTCKQSFQGDGKSCTWYREFNECDENEHNCHADAECIDTRNEFYCQCKPGFVGNGISCEDMNECTTTNDTLKHSCHQNATCSNLIGSYKCTCIDVYVGNGIQCEDRDECISGINSCHSNASCSNTDGSYTCHCLNGFSGDGFKCQDINECKGNLENCDKNAYCTNSIGSYICTCNGGYHGNGTICTDVNECTLGTHNCHVDAVCLNNNGSFNCSCKNGYEGNGTVCKDVNECVRSQHDCNENATCANTNGSFTCSCKAGYLGDGRICDDSDECLGINDCSENGTCVNSFGSYSCSCDNGYTGDGVTCDDVNECLNGTHKCNDFADCLNTFGSYKCTCIEGYIGTGYVCWDINECMERKDDCHNDSSCQNTHGSFQCTCNTGYTGNGTYCADVNECVFGTNPCHSNATCTNDKGSYMCRCDNGFTGNGYQCTDVDECLSNPCHTDATCKNTVGSYGCFCNIGYQGNGTECVDVNECTENIDNCHKDASCLNNNGSFHCFCNTGYLGNGTFCQDENECVAGKNSCDGNATCVNIIGSYKCSCNSGYNGTGYVCTDIDECNQHIDNCHDNSSCTNTVGSFYCTCNNGFSGNGINCVDVNECLFNTTNNCSNDSSCINMIGSYFCICNSGYHGDGYLCNDSDECQLGTHSCDNNASCNNTIGLYTCTCNSGYHGSGEVCNDTNECFTGKDNCHDNATCSNTVGSFSCACNKGFHGNGIICTDINECIEKLDNCSIKGYCINNIGSYGCRCNTGYQGNGFHCFDINECVIGAHNCDINANCTNNNGSFDCTCHHGYKGNGSLCQDLNECDLGTHNCHADSDCINRNGSFDCYCHSGYHGNGTNCYDTNECDNNLHNCHVDGYCTNTKGSFYCNCSHGYQGNGTHCYDINECLDGRDNCHIDSSCSNNKGSFSCSCNDGYVGNGTSCQDIDECTKSIHKCHNDAICENSKGSYKCNCINGFHGNGTQCEDINECDNNLHNCHVDGYCTNTKGSFYCNCSHDYQGNGTHCYDTNECDNNLHNCHVDGYCTNTKGSFYCNCSHGYQGNGTRCYDVNECFSNLHDCHGDATCTNVKGTYNCSCNQGYQGNGTFCQDIDECALENHACHVDAICTNHDGLYICTCKSGYHGNGTHCIDINECLIGTHLCHSDANCSNTNGSYACTCQDGYQGNGTSCDDKNECDLGTDDCHSDATCINTKGSWTCQCKQGLTGDGKTCLDILECSLGLDSCHTNAKCIEIYSNYSCQCDNGYHGNGFMCEDADECSSGSLNNCHSNAECTNSIGSFKCQCNIGYSGDGRQCSDLNECSQENVCHPTRAICVNNIGSYTCQCKQDFVGDGINCTVAMISYLFIVSILDQTWHNDLLQSSSDHFQAMETKVNTEIGNLYNIDASFSSSQLKKLMFDGGNKMKAEVIVNFKPSSKYLIKKLEAATIRGHVEGLRVEPSSYQIKEIGTCADMCTLNSYCLKPDTGFSSCACADGFEGSGKQCIDVNECDNMNGYCHHACVNVQGSYHCQCNAGFKMSSDQRSCNAISADDGSLITSCRSNYEQGLLWEDTVGNMLISKSCPNNPTEGKATRKCSVNGVWRKPYLNNCIGTQLKSISEKMRSYNLSSITWQEIKYILSSLGLAIYPPMNVLYAGDISETKHLITLLSSYVNHKIKGQSLQEVEIMLDHFNEVLNYVFDIVNHRSWQGFPDPMSQVEDYLTTINRIATVFSDHMVTGMDELSIKKPESVFDFSISSTRPEIKLHISLVEMRSFNRSRYKVPSNTTSDYEAIYPSTYFLTEVDKLISTNGIFKSIGCWADYSREAMKFSLEAKHPLLKDNYLSRMDAIDKCGYVADKLGYNIFVLQDGGLCASGSDMHTLFDKDGRANNCAYGKGGIFANSVYEINKFYSGILTVSHKHLSKLILGLTETRDRPFQKSESVEAFGDVMTTIPLKYPPKEYLSFPVEVKFHQKTENYSNIFCAQLEQRNSSIAWSTENCLTYVGNDRVVCNCTRLSHQTLLYNITNAPVVTSDDDNRYKTLSYVSFSVVCVSFLITLVLHIVCSAGKVAIIFQVNLSILTISTNAIFIFGIGSEWTIEKGLCKALTVLFHFLLTSLFSWFLALSWNSYHRLSDVIKQTYKDRTNMYFLLGYGCPCVVSLLAMAVFYDKFGVTETLCWISDTLMVSMFLPPLAMLIIMNIVVLGMVIGVYFSPRANTAAEQSTAFELEREEIYMARDTIRASSLMLPVVTVTWVFGVLRMLHDSESTKYIFLIFNIITGLTYLIGFCLLNRQMKKRLSCNESEKDDYIMDSPTLASLSLNKMRATNKHAFNNEGFMTSPKLKATAYDGKTFTNIAKSAIPTEVLFEMQQQWYNRKPDY